MKLKFIHHNRLLKVVEADPIEIRQLNLSFTVKWSVFRGIKNNGKANVKKFTKSFLKNDQYLPSGFFVDVLKLRKMGYEVNITNFDQFIRNIELEDFVDFCLKLTKKAKFTPYDYQIYGAYLSIKYRISRGEYATGSGKSYMQYLSLMYSLKLMPKDKKALVIVPSVLLVNQLHDDFLNDYGCPITPDKIYYNSKRNIGSRIVISTIDSILNMDKEFLKDIGSVYYDEAHKLKSNGYKKINSNLINQKLSVIFSVSGTFYKEGTIEDFESKAISGSVLKTLKAKELMEYGSISPVKITQLKLMHNKGVCYEYYNGMEDSKKSSYNFESEFIRKIPKRYKLIKLLCENQNYNKLLLFKRKKYLKIVSKYLSKKLKDYEVLVIHGDITPKKRDVVKKKTEKNNNIIICATDGTMSTGVSIKNLGGIHLCESTKSFILVRQSIGRALRLHPSKEYAEITDYVDVFKKHNKEWGGLKENIFKKHGLERKTIYKEQEFPYKTKKINL